MTNDGNLQLIRVRFSAITFWRASDNELFKGSEDPGQKLLFRVHFFGTDLIYATIQLKKAETAGRQLKPFKTERQTRVSLIQTSFKNAEQ